MGAGEFRSLASDAVAAWMCISTTLISCSIARSLRISFARFFASRRCALRSAGGKAAVRSSSGLPICSEDERTRPSEEGESGGGGCCAVDSTSSEGGDAALDEDADS